MINCIKVTKNDVQISTNGDCVDIRLCPAGERGRDAKLVTITLEPATLRRLEEAISIYRALDSTD